MITRDINTSEQTKIVVNSQYIENTDVLVGQYWENQASIESALFEAFDSLDIDLMDQPPLYDYLDLDAVQALLKNSQSMVRIVTSVWDFPVEITRERIHVYPKTRN